MWLQLGPSDVVHTGAWVRSVWPSDIYSFVPKYFPVYSVLNVAVGNRPEELLVFFSPAVQVQEATTEFGSWASGGFQMPPLYQREPGAGFRIWSTCTPPLFQAKLFGGGLEPVLILEPVLCISTAKVVVSGQENWHHQCGTNSLRVWNKELLMSGAGGRVMLTMTKLKLLMITIFKGPVDFFTGYGDTDESHHYLRHLQFPSIARNNCGGLNQLFISFAPGQTWLVKCICAACCALASYVTTLISSHSGNLLFILL